MRRPLPVLVPTIVLAAALVAGCGDDDGDATPTDDGVGVEIVDLAFAPSSVDVASGSTVTWENADNVPHTVTFDDGTVDSGTIAPGDSFSATLDEPGTHEYTCTIHPAMQGTVTVE